MSGIGKSGIVCEPWSSRGIQLHRATALLTWNRGGELYSRALRPPECYALARLTHASGPFKAVWNAEAYANGMRWPTWGRSTARAK